MTLKRVKLGRVVIFIKYLASVVFLTFLPKTLIWTKITFRISNSLNLAELVVRELTKSFSKREYQYFFFHPIHHCFLKRFQELITKERDNFSKILIKSLLFSMDNLELRG